MCLGKGERTGRASSSTQPMSCIHVILERAVSASHRSINNHCKCEQMSSNIVLHSLSLLHPPLSPPAVVAHLEAEFIVIGGGRKAEEAVRPLREKGCHVELVSSHSTPMHTLSEAFSRAHFSQILVCVCFILCYRTINTFLMCV